MYIYIYISVFITLSVYIPKTKLTENGNFRLFAVNGKKELENVCLFAANRNQKWKLFSLVGKKINGNRQLLFQQTCPSMYLCVCICIYA
jgi:hypothetical protein